MAQKRRRFLLGKGELLTRHVEAPKRVPNKAHPYSFEEARGNLVPELKETDSVLRGLPEAACPEGATVFTMTLHPAYIARSYYPSRFFDINALRPVGSQSRILTPRKWTRKTDPAPSYTVEIFISSDRTQPARLLDTLDQWEASDVLAQDFRKFEHVSVPMPADKLHRIGSVRGKPLYTVVLHASADNLHDFILEGFRRFASDFDVAVDLDRRIHAGGLCFIPLEADKSVLEKLATYSFLRSVSPMSGLRAFESQRGPKEAKSFSVRLPTGDALSQNTAVAIFDGGVPSLKELDQWVRRRKWKILSDPSSKALAHGLGVTSAVLFGHLEEGKPLERPYCNIMHYRVLDRYNEKPTKCDLLAILDFISNTIESKDFEFVNLSLGPANPIDDNIIDPWTAKLDELASDGRRLITIAVGNNGTNTGDDGRIQPPSDAVNGLAVGASNSLGGTWKRAPYSARGPGRMPGVVKPDLVHFGGGDAHAPDFNVLSGHLPGAVARVYGTSFAAPYVMHYAAGIRSMMGDKLSLLAIKALILHRCQNGGQPIEEVGRGRIAGQVDELLECDPDEVLVVYQGSLEPAKWLRAEVPLPKNELKGMVEIKASVCYACATDPEDAPNYTRAGLEVFFRPHSGKFSRQARERAEETGIPPSLAATRSGFFSSSEYASEAELRSDHNKWETTVLGSANMRSSSLHKPAFDVHYIARERGSKDPNPRPIPYALVVSIRAKQVQHLYQLVSNEYRNVLEVLSPELEIPIQS